MKKRSFDRFAHRLKLLGLHDAIVKRTMALHVPLRELYEGENLAPTIRAARKSIYVWLMREKGLGNNEIARLFDRAPGGIGKLIRSAEKT